MICGMLTQKPRDTNNVTMPHNHEDISNDNFVIRGISRLQIKNDRISSGAFKSSSDPYNGMSVDLAQIDDKKDGAVPDNA